MGLLGLPHLNQPVRGRLVVLQHHKSFDDVRLFLIHHSIEQLHLTFLQFNRDPFILSVWQPPSFVVDIFVVSKSTNLTSTLLSGPVPESLLDTALG